MNTFKLSLAIFCIKLFVIVGISARYYDDYSEEAEECICTLIYKPLCGSDGKTYGNICQFNCEKKARNPYLRNIRDGRCLKRRAPIQACICPKFHSPICGSDGKTYGNSCQLNCRQASNSNLRKISDGPCQSPNSRSPNQPCICPMIYYPVCGSDEKTYWNICKLNCEISKNPGLKLAKDGTC